MIASTLPINPTLSNLLLQSSLQHQYLPKDKIPQMPESHACRDNLACEKSLEGLEALSRLIVHDHLSQRRPSVIVPWQNPSDESDRSVGISCTEESDETRLKTFCNQPVETVHVDISFHGQAHD